MIVQRAARASLARVLALVLAATPAQIRAESPGAAAPSVEEPRATVSNLDRVLPPPGGAAKFRFLPDGAWTPFDRSLVLSSSEGEERSYRIEIEAEPGAQRELKTFLIDKRPPEAPKASPPTGLYRGGLEIDLSAPGARIFWAIAGAFGSRTAADGAGEPASSGFRPYGEGARPAIPAPTSGTATYALIAYAEDEAGNRSAISRFVYRLAEPELPAAAPSPAKANPPPESSPEIAQPEIDGGPGRIVLRRTLSPEESFAVSVNPRGGRPVAEDFAIVDGARGIATFVVACPYGWSGVLPVFYGVKSGDRIKYNPLPIPLRVADRPEPPAPAPVPRAPGLASDPSGLESFVAFPPYPGTLYVSIDGGPDSPYLAPIRLPAGTGRTRVEWFGEDGLGTRSERAWASLEAPSGISDVELKAPRNGAVLGSDAFIEPSAPAVVRYEMSVDGGPPPEPSAASRLLGAGIAVPCPVGESRTVTLRYRVFSSLDAAASASEGRVIRFTIDKRPPRAPRVVEPPPPFSDKPQRLVFAADEGSEVFVSVSKGGAAADFAPATEIELGGDESGPASYTIRAYAVSRAGVRSAEMRTLAVTIDRDSIYASSDGPEKGEGSPDRPYRSLEAAVAAALAGGKRNVNIRGDFSLAGPVEASSNLRISGGFGSGWAAVPGRRAAVRVAQGLGPAIAARGAALVLSGISLSSATRGGAIVHASRGSVELLDSSIEVQGDGDSVMISAEGSRVAVTRSSLVAGKALTCTAIDASGSDLEIRDSIIGAKRGVRAFVAVNAKGGSLSVAASLVESSADLAVRLLSLEALSCLVERSIVRVDSGSGNLRIASFRGVPGEIRSCKFLVAWRGPATLFEYSGEGPAFRHDTVVAESASGSLRFFDASGPVPEIWNSILECPSGDAELLRSSEPPRAGSLVSDCLWGFSSFASGASRIWTAEELDALNRSDPLYAARKHVVEAPFKTFAPSAKSLYPLSPASACVGAAIPLDARYRLDLNGKPRPTSSDAALPDIGAEELQE